MSAALMMTGGPKSHRDTQPCIPWNLMARLESLTGESGQVHTWAFRLGVIWKVDFGTSKVWVRRLGHTDGNMEIIRKIDRGLGRVSQPSTSIGARCRLAFLGRPNPSKSVGHGDDSCTQEQLWSPHTEGTLSPWASGKSKSNQLNWRGD